MYNDILLSFAAKVIPICTLSFVGILLCYKIYIKIRSKFNATVNCWFCNENTKVPYQEINRFTCPKCEQYNGFNRDGDYNREIFEQLDCSNLSFNKVNYLMTVSSHNSSRRSAIFTANGFCHVCNEAQRIKVEKLAQFEPKNESNFDQELKVYKEKLEKEYRLCDTCERHLKYVLRDKKKMVLGSKFLDLILKRAENIKQPHFNKLNKAKIKKRKQLIAALITFYAFVNIFCLLIDMPTITRSAIVDIVGETIGYPIFICLSHIITLWRVMASYLETANTNETLIKIKLFINTIFRMLLYSLGLKLHHVINLDFRSLYMILSPFFMLGLSFGYHIVDGLKLTRYSFILVIWSVFAGGLIDDNLLKFAVPFITFLLSVTRNTKHSSKIIDCSQNASFHKLYSDDYFSDEDTISILSEQLNSSSVSMRSVSPHHKSFNYSPSGQFRSPPKQISKTPSLFSLHQFPPRKSINNLQKPFCMDDNPLRRPQFTNSIDNVQTIGKNASTIRSPSLFTSNLELGHFNRPASRIFAMDSSNSLNHNENQLNNSFTQPHKIATPMHNATFTNSASIPDFGDLRDGSLFDNSRHPCGNTIFSKPVNYPSIHSPFSASTSTVYSERHSNVLTPSRFNTNAASTSWLSGGYFNQPNPMQFHGSSTTIGASATAANTARKSNGIAGMYEIRNDDDASRASSRSSGFESQTGRENSIVREGLEPSIQCGTSSLDTSNTFQPVANNGDSVGGNLYDNTRLFNTTNRFSQPLTVNCSFQDGIDGGSVSTVGGFDTNTNSIWNVRNRQSSFNLQKISEELPTLQRGDLLRKWKESQTTIAQTG